MKQCPICRTGEIKNSQERYELRVDSIALVAIIATERCNNCNETTCTLDQLSAGEIAVARYCLMHGQRSAGAHRLCRKALGYTASELAIRYGIPDTAVKRMERDGNIDEARWATLASLLEQEAVRLGTPPAVEVIE